MPCCGQKRAAVARAAYGRTQIKAASMPVPAPKAPQPNEASNTQLRYLGAAPISLRGSNTGHVYYFDRAGDVAGIHENDVDALLLTRLFAREDQ
jgi:hypothetical protein